MARRRLLADAFWAGIYALPSEEREVVRHCTLTPDDLALAAIKRGPHSRLGYALLLLALRHPGRALEPGEVPPTPLVAYVARQVGADPAALEAHRLRPQTRREQLAELCRGRWLDDADAERILVTTGSQQALDLVITALTDPGDVVVVERPSYLAALQLFRLSGLRVVSVETDEDGLDPGAVAASLRRYPLAVDRLETLRESWIAEGRPATVLGARGQAGG